MLLSTMLFFLKKHIRISVFSSQQKRPAFRAEPLCRSLWDRMQGFCLRVSLVSWLDELLINPTVLFAPPLPGNPLYQSFSRVYLLWFSSFFTMATWRVVCSTAS